MSKNHRGTELKLTTGWRGTCPVCKRTGIKVLYEQQIDEKKVSVCKQCKAALAHGRAQAKNAVTA